MVAIFLPGMFPAACRCDGRSGYFEAASVIVCLVLAGQVLELKARAQTGDAICALLDLAPKTARGGSATAARTRCAAWPR